MTVNYSGGAILDSPYEAFEIVGGDGTGHVVNGLNISNVKVQNTGTTVFEAETGGAASVSGVTASGIGVSGTYNNSYPGNVAGAYTFNLGSGNSGWSTTPVLTTFPDPVQPGALHATPSSSVLRRRELRLDQRGAGRDHHQPGHQRRGICPRSAPPDCSQQTNNCGSSLAAGASCTVQVKFAPTTGGNATGTLTVATSAPGGPLSVALSGHGITSTTNLALGQPATASSTQGTFVAGDVTDGNTGSYWESSDGAGYPQTVTVDLGSTQPIGSATLNLPPSSAWNTRTQTLSVLGSTDGTTFSQIVGSANYTFDPSTGNAVTISLPSGTSARYVRLSFTANTGWSAAQLSEFQIFPGGSSTGNPSALKASPSSVAFGNVAVGSTSAAQTVTVSNPGTTTAALSSVSATGPFSQTNNCGSSLAAGASCSVQVSFTPTAAGAANGTLSIASNAPGSPLTVTLSGTGTTSGNTNLALNKPTTASGTTQNYGPGNTVDGNTSSYWESADNAFPQWIQVDLGASASVSHIVMDLPPSSSWATRTQTIQIQGSTDGTNYTTLAPSQGYTFNPSTGNTASATFTAANVRYVKLTFTANTGWPAGQLSELQVFSQ